MTAEPEFYSFASQSEKLTFVNPRKNGTFWDFLSFLIYVMLYLCYNYVGWRFPMIRKDKKTFKDGSVKTQIRVTEGYRPFPNSSPKQRTIKSFGYLEDQEDQDAFWKEVHACNDSLKKSGICVLKSLYLK